LPEWLASGQATVVKQGVHRTVYHVHRGDLDFYVKHYPVPDCRARLRALVRPSKARMEYDRALAVAARGVPTFVPLAVGETCPRSTSGVRSAGGRRGPTWSCSTAGSCCAAAGPTACASGTPTKRHETYRVVGERGA